MPPKHEVDPTTQASMLAPPLAALATDAVVELEGGFYRPTEEPPTLEQTALKKEGVAIFLLGKACTTKRNITNMESHQHNLKTGRVKAGTDIPSELASLASTDEKGKPIGAIPTAQKRYRDFRQRAKITFAESIGIETVIEPEERMIDGRPIMVEMVRAQDPNRRDELTRRYREFDDLYGKPGKKAAAARKRRQEEIEEIQANLRPKAA